MEPSFAGGEKYRELPQGAEAQTLLSPHLFDQERSYEDVMGTKECWGPRDNECAACSGEHSPVIYPSLKCCQASATQFGSAR